MGRRFLLSFVIVSAIASACGGSMYGRPIDSPFLSVDRAIDAAILKGDIDFLERTLDSTFRFTHGDGKSQSKKDFIDAVRAGRMLAKTRDVDEQEVELHGEIAVVTGRIHVIRDAPDPARREYSIWYVRVYATRGKEVVLLSHRTVRTTLPA